MPVKRHTALTQERARELFNYDPETGVLTRRIDVHSGRGSERGGGKIQCRAGDVAGRVNEKTGYLECRADGPIYRTHRIIWVWWYGYFPEHDIDHIDRDKTNNRISNLREVTRSCNVKNRDVLVNNVSGVTGVCYSPVERKWKATITDNKERKHLGTFKTKLEAVMARHKAEKELKWATCDTTSPARSYLIEQNILKA